RNALSVAKIIFLRTAPNRRRRKVWKCSNCGGNHKTTDESCPRRQKERIRCNKLLKNAQIGKKNTVPVNSTGHYVWKSTKLSKRVAKPEMINGPGLMRAGP